MQFPPATKQKKLQLIYRGKNEKEFTLISDIEISQSDT
jgi:hypothetical protein